MHARPEDKPVWLLELCVEKHRRSVGEDRSARARETSANAKSEAKSERTRGSDARETSTNALSEAKSERPRRSHALHEAKSERTRRTYARETSPNALSEAKSERTRRSHARETSTNALSEAKSERTRRSHARETSPHGYPISARRNSGEATRSHAWLTPGRRAPGLCATKRRGAGEASACPSQ